MDNQLRFHPDTARDLSDNPVQNPLGHRAPLKSQSPSPRSRSDNRR
jgi:hypothetical protein